MSRIGSRGQAFDVFKLLIAAVVAIAILVMLMNILNLVPGIGSEDPQKVAEDLIKSKSTSIGSPGYNNVTFKTDQGLNAKTLAEKSDGLSEEQICVTLTGTAPNAGQFDTLADGALITYNGSSAQKARLMALCDRSKDIESTVTNYKFDTKYGLSLGKCDSLDADKTQKFCVVAVISES